MIFASFFGNFFDRIIAVSLERFFGRSDIRSVTKVETFIFKECEKFMLNIILFDGKPAMLCTQAHCGYRVDSLREQGSRNKNKRSAKVALGE